MEDDNDLDLNAVIDITIHNLDNLCDVELEMLTLSSLREFLDRGYSIEDLQEEL